MTKSSLLSSSFLSISSKLFLLSDYDCFNNSSTKVDFVATVSNATAGIVSLSLSAATTNAMKAGRYVYDVEIDLNGTKTRVLEGQLEVTPGVTR